MKKIGNTGKVSTDNIYYVSAADVADKIIEHMRRDPLLFSSSRLTLIPVGPMLRARLRAKLD